MREIKFRAWDELLKHMVYQEGTGRKYEIPAYGILKDYDKVMQFTGLKDKNGYLIYEGDIVKAKDEMSDHEINGTVLYFDRLGYFAVEFFDGEQMGHLRFNDFHKDSIEVIGNIYESEAK